MAALSFPFVSRHFQLPITDDPQSLLLPDPNLDPRNPSSRFLPLIAGRTRELFAKCSVRPSSSTGGGDDDGFVLEDVPHLANYLPDLKEYTSPLKRSPAYAIVKQSFVSPEDVVAERIVTQKNSPRGVHFRRAGPREKVYFKSDEVRACIVTCGGLCQGINTVIREIVCGLSYMYGVNDVIGIEFVNDIHKRGGTFLRTSRGGHDTDKIVDSIQFRGINQVYIIGGDGTQKGVAAISQEVEKRGLRVAVAGIPKTIDNDIAILKGQADSWVTVDTAKHVQDMIPVTSNGISAC